MATISISMPHAMLDAARRHLLPQDSMCEEAAFLFAQAVQSAEGVSLNVIDWMTIPPDGFTSRSVYYLELADRTRAMIIKKAHDLQAGIVELHSHPMQSEAQFSWSDLHGFDEFVPHVMWRLKGRPYAAVVFTRGSIDALAWAGPDGEADAINAIVTESGELRPTGLTLGNWREIYDRQSL